MSNVLALKYEKKEIIIINDGSSDNTAELIYKIKENNDFIFVDLQENRGKTNALNQGIKQASYDYVMCLDADTIVDQDAPYYMIEISNMIQNLVQLQVILEFEIRVLF